MVCSFHCKLLIHLFRAKWIKPHALKTFTDQGYLVYLYFFPISIEANFFQSLCHERRNLKPLPRGLSMKRKKMGNKPHALPITHIDLSTSRVLTMYGYVCSKVIYQEALTIKPLKNIQDISLVFRNFVFTSSFVLFCV